jgi:hypothetical protein
MTQKILKLLLVLPLIVSIVFPACSLHPQPLGEYLEDLFESHDIIVADDDFFEPVDDPYLAFAKMLLLIPASYQSDERITKEEAAEISAQFMAIKDYILLDGLYGKIDMHEHYRDGGDVGAFLQAAGCLGISHVVFLPTGVSPDNEGYKTHQASLLGEVLEQYPERVIPFCTLDESDPAPGWCRGYQAYWRSPQFL